MPVDPAQRAALVPLTGPDVDLLSELVREHLLLEPDPGDAGFTLLSKLTYAANALSRPLTPPP